MESEQTKRCYVCDCYLPMNEFSKDVSRPDNKSPRCRSCTRDERLWITYGIGTEDYDSMLEAQNNRCAICGCTNADGRSGFFHIDHDHKTGKVRGILCNNCNNGLGRFKDNPVFLLNATKYIEKQYAY